MQLFTSTKENQLYNASKDLTCIANELETDKGTANKTTLSWGKDWPEHITMGYTITYEKYMHLFREKNVKFFEIGICDKRFPYASPKMWMTYFKNVKLYGMDNYWGTNLNDRFDEIKMLNDMGVNFVYADQGNYLDWEDIKKQCPNDFDFFVEDGSHWSNHMLVSLWQARDIMKCGGYYFMEDIQNPKRTRGKFRYDNSIVAEDLLEAEHSGILEFRMLNDQQNEDVQKNYELVELVLDNQRINYLAVFKKK